MNILCTARKVFIVFLYLSFFIFPLIFANNVYAALKIENSKSIKTGDFFDCKLIENSFFDTLFNLRITETYEGYL